MCVVRLSQYRHQLEVEHVQNMCPFFQTYLVYLIDDMRLSETE